MRFAYLTFLPKSTKVKVLLHAAALHLLFLFGIASVIQMPLLASPHHLRTARGYAREYVSFEGITYILGRPDFWSF